MGSYGNINPLSGQGDSRGHFVSDTGSANGALNTMGGNMGGEHGGGHGGFGRPPGHSGYYYGPPGHAVYAPSPYLPPAGNCNGYNRPPPDHPDNYCDIYMYMFI